MIRLAHTIVVTFLLVIFLFTSSLVPTARTAVIDTSVYIEKAQAISLNELNQLVDRKDVQDQLVAFGVDPEDAQKRIASLNESELILLQDRIHNLPAGSSALAVLGVVLVVLIVLELLGVTNVFTKL